MTYRFRTRIILASTNTSGIRRPGTYRHLGNSAPTRSVRKAADVAIHRIALCLHGAPLSDVEMCSAKLPNLLSLHPESWLSAVIFIPFLRLDHCRGARYQIGIAPYRRGEMAIFRSSGKPEMPIGYAGLNSRPAFALRSTAVCEWHRRCTCPSFSFAQYPVELLLRALPCCLTRINGSPACIEYFLESPS